MNSTHTRPRALLSTACLALLLVGCGGGASDPGVPPTPTAPSALDASAIGAATTLGVLADRIAAAWPSATAIVWSRATFDPASAPTTAIADPSLAGFTFINEADAAGDRRMTILSGKVVAGSLVVVDGAVRAWGLMPIPAAAISAPDAAGWVEVTPAAALADPQGGQLVTTLLAPLVPVYGGLPPAQRALAATPIGPQAFGSRTCDAWRIEDLIDGVPVITILGIDASGLPCGTAITANGQTALTLWTFGGTLDISLPDGTPVPPSV